MTRLAGTVDHPEAHRTDQDSAQPDRPPLDTKANQTKGEGSTSFGGEWYVMGAKGKVLDGD